MSYARLAAMAGAVVLAFAPLVRCQEPKDDAPSSKAASPADPTSPSDRSSLRSNQTPAEAQRSEPIAPDERVIQFSFVTQPWENVLDWIAKLAGMSLQMEVKPSGTFNYINDPNKYTLGEAIDIINAQLISKGHILLRKGNYLKVIAFKDGVPPDLIRHVTVAELETSGDSEYVTVFLPLENVAAKTAADEIKGFASEVGSKIVAQESVNQLMITDLVSNIRLMRDYLSRVDAAGDAMKSRYRVFALKFASAARVESMLRELFGLPPRQTAAQQSSSSRPDREDPRERFRRMMEGGGNPFMQMFSGQPGGDRGGGDRGDRGDRGGDSRDRSGGSSQLAPSTGVTMSVDEPRNQILVMAPPDKLAIVEEFIKQVDVPRPGDSEFAPREPQVPTVGVIRLSDGDAQSLATALTQIYQNTPGVRFSADQSNNAVVVVATPDDQEAIKRLAEKFEESERDSVVMPLTVLDAGSVSELLSTVYSSGETDWRGRTTTRPGQPRIVADRTRNQLMVRGSKKQVDDIRSMLGALGEPQLSRVSGNDRLRVIPLNAANSKAIRDLVEQVWPTVSPNNNPIRLIELGKKEEEPAVGERGEREVDRLDRRRNERLREGGRPASDSEGESKPPDRERPAVPGRTSIKPPPSLFRFVSQTRDEQEAGKKANDQVEEKGADDKSGAPLVVSFGPDSAVVASDDPAAVQAFMNLINSLTRSTSTGSEYTVFYLKSAEATALQQTLSDLMGLSVTPSFFGGSSAQSSSLVKIVPDTRTNSLIVFGNATEVSRIEQLIRVLDRDDAPASGALSAPRIIPVKHASASSVARVIRDVYASRITGGSGMPGSQGMQFGGSPFSPFGSSSRSSSRPSAGSLSVGVDEQSNSIVVACTESTYQEISRLVETLDLAANETQRTVQIVTVKNSTPSAVQDALNGLMGISTSPTSSSRYGDSSGRSSGGYPYGGNSTGFTPSFGGFPGGFQGGSPFGGSFFDRGGDRGRDRGSDRSRFFEGRGDFGRDRRP